MIYKMIVLQFSLSLRNLEELLKKGKAHADSKKASFDNLLQARTIFDQFPLIRQVQIACDTAKFAAARITEKEAPKHEDNEKTFEDLQKRIQETIVYLESFKESDFSNASTVKFTTPRWEGKYLTGENYAKNHAIPNFYFHITTAYTILRMNGVDVGKKDYLGSLPFEA